MQRLKEEKKETRPPSAVTNETKWKEKNKRKEYGLREAFWSLMCVLLATTIRPKALKALSDKRTHTPMQCQRPLPLVRSHVAAAALSRHHCTTVRACRTIAFSGSSGNARSRIASARAYSGSAAA